MSNRYFFTQEATADILLRVTNVCGECYHELKEGDLIHYDMQNYRYLCNGCQEEFCEVEKQKCEASDEVGEGLF